MSDDPKPLTVGQLREALVDIPDDTLVYGTYEAVCVAPIVDIQLPEEIAKWPKRYRPLESAIALDVWS